MGAGGMREAACNSNSVCLSTDRHPAALAGGRTVWYGWFHPSSNSIKYLNMNKLLAALIATFFAAGIYAADAKPAAAAASAAPAAKAEKKDEKKEAAKPAAAPASAAAKK